MLNKKIIKCFMLSIIFLKLTAELVYMEKKNVKNL